jgi:pimeloyl-ACP methyl ester carboxylesterase
MKNMTNLKKRFFGIASVLAITTTGLVAVPTVANANPVCTNKVIFTECVGVTSDRAPYIFQIPAKFSGTFFLFSHGYRYPIDIPASIPLVGGYTVTNTPQPTGGRNAAEIQEVALGMLTKGYGIGGSGFARQGWNVDSGLKTNVELIGIIKKQFPTVTKVVAWGESLGAFITQALSENHSDLISAAGNLCPAAGSPEASVKLAGDALWGIKTMFDPSIQGGNYKSVLEVYADIGRVLTVAGAMQAAIVANPTFPAWPATATTVPAAIKSAIPSRSALVLVAAMAGLPTQSASFDGATGPGPQGTLIATQFAAGISPALGALENITTAAVLGIMFAYDVEQQAGGVVYDNTKTNYTAQLGDGIFEYNSALSGLDAAQTLLAYVAAAPRSTGNPAAMEKVKTLTAHKGVFNVPTITLGATADNATPAGHAQWLAEKAVENYLASASNKNSKLAKTFRSNHLALWQVTPDSYTKFSATGSPISQRGVNGTGHCNITPKQHLAIADLLAASASSGQLVSGQKVLTAIRKAGGITYARDFSAPLLKYYQN